MTLFSNGNVIALVKWEMGLVLLKEAIDIAERQIISSRWTDRCLGLQLPDNVTVHRHVKKQKKEMIFILPSVNAPAPWKRDGVS